MNNKFDYAPVIEKMTDEQLAKRIQEGMDYKIKNKIRPVPYLGEKEEVVEYRFPEFIARCPMTGIRDLYDISILIVPNKLIPELKSLKFYFWGYDELPISHEHIAAKLFKEIKGILAPTKLKIIVRTAERGEITTTVEVGDDIEIKTKPFTRNF